jgi:hypothetical protein
MKFVTGKQRSWRRLTVVSEADVLICIETLNFKMMQSLWGKKISDLAQSGFYWNLERLMLQSGAQMVAMPRFYPSSKICRYARSQRFSVAERQIVDLPWLRYAQRPGL